MPLLAAYSDTILTCVRNDGFLENVATSIPKLIIRAENATLDSYFVGNSILDPLFIIFPGGQ